MGASKNNKVEQTHKTKNFVALTKALKEGGEAKYVDIAKALDIDPSMMSNIKEGRINIPNHKYALFNKLYPGIIKLEPEAPSAQSLIRKFESKLIAGLFYPL